MKSKGNRNILIMQKALNNQGFLHFTFFILNYSLHAVAIQQIAKAP